MAIEIEIKMKVADPVGMERLLHDRLGPMVSDVMETNVFYDTPAGLLQAGDSGLRVRAVREFTDGRGVHAVMTFKGPRKPGAVKSREEIEVAVGEAGQAGELLKKLGYAEQLCFEKRRKSWRWKECHVELDELPRLGHFLEIEGPTEEAVMALREQLGLSGLPLVRDGYATLLADDLQQHGLPGHSVLFTPVPNTGKRG